MGLHNMTLKKLQYMIASTGDIRWYPCSAKTAKGAKVQAGNMFSPDSNTILSVGIQLGDGNVKTLAIKPGKGHWETISQKP